MPGELWELEKAGKTAVCEKFQIAAMEGKGWSLIGPYRPEPEARAESDPVPVPLAPGLRRVVKGDVVGYVDNANLARALKGGFVLEDEARTEAAEASDDDLALFLAALDPDDDDLWNKDGSVKLAALGELLGQEVSRDEVERAAPGLTRDSLREADED